MAQFAVSLCKGWHHPPGSQTHHVSPLCYRRAARLSPTQGVATLFHHLAARPAFRSPCFVTTRPTGRSQVQRSSCRADYRGEMGPVKRPQTLCILSSAVLSHGPAVPPALPPPPHVNSLQPLLVGFGSSYYFQNTRRKRYWPERAIVRPRVGFITASPDQSGVSSPRPVVSTVNPPLGN